MTDKKWIVVILIWLIVFGILPFLPYFIHIGYCVIMPIALGWIFVGLILYVFLSAHIDKNQNKNKDDKENNN